MAESMPDSFCGEDAKKGLQLLIERGYQRALEAGEIIHFSDGNQGFPCHFPEPINKDCNAIRSPDGVIHLRIKDFYELLGGEEVEPFEHFEHKVEEFCSRHGLGFGDYL